MKKHIALILLACAASPIAVGVSYADPAPVAECTSESRDAQVPSGTLTDESGRTWVGFKAGGLPPDSLSKSSESVTCIEYED